MSNSIAEQSAISVTIDAPPGLPPISANVHIHPKTVEEFEAVVEAVGGPGVFRASVYEWVTADLPGDVRLMLYQPATYERPSRPQYPFIAEFNERVEQARAAAAGQETC
jgi:hypothetical protein